MLRAMPLIQTSTPGCQEATSPPCRLPHRERLCPSIVSGAQPKGYFGTQTQAALSAFRAFSVGITSNGYFGPITRAWINSHGNANNGGGSIISPAQPIQPTYPTSSTYPSYPSYPTYPTYPANSTSAPIITRLTRRRRWSSVSRLPGLSMCSAIPLQMAH